MKVRSCFVSNSSSCSYVLAIPLTYELTDDDIEIMKTCCDWDELLENSFEGVEADLIKNIKEVYERLRSGESVDPEYDDTGVSTYLIKELLDKKGMTICAADGCGSNVTMFVNIFAKPEYVKKIGELIKEYKI